MVRTTRRTIEAIHSRRDSFGNVYWSCIYTDLETDRKVRFTIPGGESNLNALRLHTGIVGEWDSETEFSTRELPIREFNQLTKSWEYGGCVPAEIWEFIQKKLAE